jgi:feruloyl esterase
LPHAAVTEAADVALGPNGHACKVAVTARPTADSDIRIEIWIPEGAAWNGRFVQLGNGGFAGQVDERDLAALAAAGYATAGTDDGHQTADETDARWALGHPAKVVDYGWRAIKEATAAAKTLIRAYEGGAPKYAYFEGCSDGGREALMEAQRFPTDFDGIIAGAPSGWNGLVRLWTHDIQAVSRRGAYLDTSALQALQTAALAACGGGGPFVADEQNCRFDPASTACSPRQTSGCLTPAQVAAAESIYRGLEGPKGSVALPGQSPSDEADPGGWSLWITGPSPDQIDKALVYRFAQGYWADFVYGDPKLDLRTLNLAAAAKAEGPVAKELLADDPDLSKFRAAGGKLIQYHGWNDPAIPARASIAYYEDVRRAMGGDVSDFYRLYLIPGMLHCGGGPGPGDVAWLDALRAWVEQGEAPEALVATNAGRRDSPAPAPGKQRLCPYPKRPDPGDKCA